MANDSLYHPELWRKLEERSIPEPNSGCLLWMTTIDPYGYGQMRINSPRTMAKSHRLAWIAARGPIPAGLHVCHKCDVPGCVNPDHLFIGTPSDNTCDSFRKGRSVRDRGEEQHLARLTTETVPRLVQRWRLGERTIDLAQEFGVGETTLHNIWSGNSWGWLTGIQKGERRMPKTSSPSV